MKLSHVDEAGRARMVDVGDKPVTVRTAVAEGAIRMSREAFRLVADQQVAKGDVLAVSEVAGTLAAKRTAELIPLCHPLGLDHVEVDATLDEGLPGVRVRATAKADGRGNGGAHGGVGRPADGLRHGEGGGPGDGDRQGPTARKDGWHARGLAAN